MCKPIRAVCMHCLITIEVKIDVFTGIIKIRVSILWQVLIASRPIQVYEFRQEANSSKA